MDAEDAEQLPPETLVRFVERCLDIDDAAIKDFNINPIERAMYNIGWDRFAVYAELGAKRIILENYRAAKAALNEAEQHPNALWSLEGCAARARALESGRAFRAVAGTFRDRYDYGAALHGIQDPAENTPEPAPSVVP